MEFTVPASGTVTGMGGLPHRDASEAAAFALALQIPSIPQLPRRSPAEGAIAQAMVGMRGITVGQYGSLSVDADLVDPLAPVVTDLHHDAFVGFRTFLDAAAPAWQPGGWVKWQLVGPITLGTALVRAGVPASEAYESAVRAVRARAQHLVEAVSERLADCRQLVFVEEPEMASLMEIGYPLAPDAAIDLVSGSLAAIEPFAVAGLHVCGIGDVASQLATGPAVLSLPVHESLAASAGYLAAFMDRGGLIAWGAVSTIGPITTSVERPWKALCSLWCDLVRRGIDPVMLRQQSLITPDCGLASHTPSVAARVFRIAGEIGERVRDQSMAHQWVLGA
jgi:hypothetical protein